MHRILSLVTETIVAESSSRLGSLETSVAESFVRRILGAGLQVFDDDLSVDEEEAYLCDIVSTFARGEDSSGMFMLLSSIICTLSK